MGIRKQCLAIAVAAVVGSAATGFASTITFDTVSGAGNPQMTTLTTQGFTFTSGHFHAIGDPSLALFGGDISDGTVYIAEEAGGLGQPITMTEVGGGAFTLNGFDGGPNFMDGAAAAAGGVPNASEIDVVGTLFGGGPVRAALTLNGTSSFQTLSVGGSFVNVTSVTFSGKSVTGGTGGISLDNIVVNGAVAAPLPTSAGLGILGLVGAAGMSVARRRRLA